MFSNRCCYDLERHRTVYFACKKITAVKTRLRTKLSRCRRWKWCGYNCSWCSGSELRCHFLSKIKTVSGIASISFTTSITNAYSLVSVDNSSLSGNGRVSIVIIKHSFTDTLFVATKYISNSCTDNTNSSKASLIWWTGGSLGTGPYVRVDTITDDASGLKRLGLKSTKCSIARTILIRSISTTIGTVH